MTSTAVTLIAASAGCSTTTSSASQLTHADDPSVGIGIGVAFVLNNYYIIVFYLSRHGQLLRRSVYKLYIIFK